MRDLREPVWYSFSKGQLVPVSTENADFETSFVELPYGEKVGIHLYVPQIDTEEFEKMNLAEYLGVLESAMAEERVRGHIDTLVLQLKDGKRRIINTSFQYGDELDSELYTDVFITPECIREKFAGLREKYQELKEQGVTLYTAHGARYTIEFGEKGSRVIYDLTDNQDLGEEFTTIKLQHVISSDLLNTDWPIAVSERTADIYGEVLSGTLFVMDYRGVLCRTDYGRGYRRGSNSRRERVRDCRRQLDRVGDGLRRGTGEIFDDFDERIGLFERGNRRDDSFSRRHGSRPAVRQSRSRDEFNR